MLSLCVALALLLADHSFGDSPRQTKQNLSIGAARRAMGDVASYQGFPTRYRLDRKGSLEAEGEFFHIFVSYMAKARKWRTLVFDNSGNYLGYYQAANEPVELDKDCLVYPGDDYSAEFGDDAEGEFDHGTAYRIMFGGDGPPDEVKFETRTYTFVSSPMRVRPEDPGYPFIRIANRIANAMNRGRYKKIHEDFGPKAKARMTEEQVETSFSNLRDNLGRMEWVDTPWIQAPDTAVLPVMFQREVAGLKLMLDEQEKIEGLWILPFKTAFPDLGQNKTEMTLPFNGRWRAMWGGGTRENSKYFGNRSCHHVLEFVISTRFGKTHRGDGRHNEDYFAFGKPVLAPAAGTVVAVVDGVKDNRPHAPNTFDRLGNAVMIQHSTNEYSVVAHLKQDSVVVRVGDDVLARQPIALCGNSGDSSQPSIYFQLQDSPAILSGSGYHTVFSNLYVLKKGEVRVVDGHSPVRGEYVQQRLVSAKADSAGEGGNAEPAAE